MPPKAKPRTSRRPTTSERCASVSRNAIVMVMDRDEVRELVRGLRLKVARADSGGAIWTMHGHGLIVQLCRPSERNKLAEYLVVVVIDAKTKG